MGCLLRFALAAVGATALFIVWIYAYTSTPLPL
jgi:hypothetical protein